MVIVAGKIYVAPGDRDKHIASFEDMTRRARAYPGCLDVYIVADPIEPGRINIFEQFESEEALEAWRVISNPPEPVTEMLSADVQKHQVTASGPPFDE